MGNARELLALRHHLAAHLQPHDLTRLAWPALTTHAQTAINRGWTGQELAETALLGAYSDNINDPIAYLVAGIRDLATTDPPRDHTPTPTHITEHQAAAAQAKANASNDPHYWANLIRNQIHQHQGQR